MQNTPSNSLAAVVETKKPQIIFLESLAQTKVVVPEETRQAAEAYLAGLKKAFAPLVSTNERYTEMEAEGEQLATEIQRAENSDWKNTKAASECVAKREQLARLNRQKATLIASAGHHTDKLVSILNDASRYIARVLNPTYNTIRDQVAEFIAPVLGQSVQNAQHIAATNPLCFQLELLFRRRFEQPDFVLRNAAFAIKVLEQALAGELPVKIEISSVSEEEGAVQE